MSGPRIIILIAGIFVLIVLILAIFQTESLSQWLRYEWMDLLYAFILAIIAGLLIEFIYRRYSAKSKSQTTRLQHQNQQSSC